MEKSKELQLLINFYKKGLDYWNDKAEKSENLEEVYQNLVQRYAKAINGDSEERVKFCFDNKDSVLTEKKST